MWECGIKLIVLANRKQPPQQHHKIISCHSWIKDALQIKETKIYRAYITWSV